MLFRSLFAIAVSLCDEKYKRPVIHFAELLSEVMFKFTNFVMMFAPFGVGAAMAATIGHQGLEVLKNLGMLIGSLYIALILFVVLVLGAVALIARVPVRQFLRDYEASGVDEIILLLNPRAHEGIMESIELMGTQILPALQRDLPDVAFRVPTPGLRRLDGGGAEANALWPGLVVRYTTDGSEPDAGSTVANGRLPAGVLLKAAAFDRSGQRSLSTGLDLR